MTPPATRREIFAWAMFDFANSGYTTVVLTAIFNAYFVAVVAGGPGGMGPGTATLAWTSTIAVSNLLVLLTAPFLGALADHRAAKKRLLALSTLGCVGATAALATVGPGEVVWGAALVVLSAFLFATGEDLIAAFLPEIAPPEKMGRISGYGWALGYVGGLAVLALCLVYTQRQRALGFTSEHFVPMTMLIVAAAYGLGSLPTFLWLRERAEPSGDGRHAWTVVRESFSRVLGTVRDAGRYQDLFRLLAAISVYTCGINTVVVLAAVYAQQVLGMTEPEAVGLILVVNVAAALGAFAFGHVQDRFGSVRTLNASLVLWIAATSVGVFAESTAAIWVAGHLIGLAMGASQSAGRALVGQLAPRERTAEFFGLWGLAVKLSAIVGPTTYGVVGYLSGGNHRLGLVSTVVFFVGGMWILRGVDERRGRAVAFGRRAPAA